MNYLVNVYDEYTELTRYFYSCELSEIKPKLEEFLGKLNKYDDQLENDKYQVFIYQLEEVDYEGT